MTKDKYLGDFAVELEGTPFAKFTPADWALYFIERYGGIKQWLLDRLARVLNDAPVHVVQARWESGQAEYRVRVGTGDKYAAWVKHMKAGEEGPETYAWDEGVPP